MSEYGNTTTTYNKSIHDHRVESGSAYTMVTLSDTEDLTFVDLAGEYADHRLNKAYCRGFHANTTGTVVVVGPGNLDERSQVAMNVVAGTKYDYSIRRFKLTGSTFGDSSTWRNHIIAWR